MTDIPEKPAKGEARPSSSPLPGRQDQSSGVLASIYNRGRPPDPGGGQGADPEAQLGGKMTFLEHLDELRRRILYCVAALLVAFLASWVFIDRIFTFLAQPIYETVGKPLHIIKPTEGFTIYLKVAFFAAIVIAVPVILYQIYMFIAPGLYRREKFYVAPFLASSILLFFLGAAFSYYVILPSALNFLVNEFGGQFESIITAVEFFDFEVLVVVGMGAIFQLPVLVAFLSLFGLVTPSFLWRNFRYAFLLMVILAAVISPTTDPFNLFLWSGPLVLLYLVSIGVSWIFNWRRREAG